MFKKIKPLSCLKQVMFQTLVLTHAPFKAGGRLHTKSANVLGFSKSRNLLQRFSISWHSPASFLP